jgi:flagellin-like protein
LFIVNNFEKLCKLSILILDTRKSFCTKLLYTPRNQIIYGNMKGISAVIATILMLMITIALAGTAYLYITGIFTSRTGVVLSIEQSTCPTGGAVVTVRNDGTGVASNVLLTLTGPNGTTTGAGTCPAIATINAGTSNSTTCTGRTAGTGLYAITVSGGTSNTQGSIYCAS